MRIDSKKNIVYPAKTRSRGYCDKVAGAVGCCQLVFWYKNKITGRSYANAAD